MGQQQSAARRYLIRAAQTAGVVSLSVLVTVLVMRAVAPPRATAQPEQGGEVRASSFVLVGQDGRAIARLGPGADGAAGLTLFDSRGLDRVAVTSRGAIVLRDAAGATRIRLETDVLTGDPRLTLDDEGGSPRLQLWGATGGTFGMAVLTPLGEAVTTVP